MATYAIGDLQGCLDELYDLLETISFNENNDRLWFTGDIINRGPKSLETLRFVKSLKSAQTVLGNHDLHLLGIAYQVRKQHRNDTFDKILNAPDKDELISWIRNQPLLIHDKQLGFTLFHAGLPPQWSLKKAKKAARKTEALIQSDDFEQFIHAMYGDNPSIWQKDLSDLDKYRYRINSFTRLRYCTQNGGLDFSAKGAPGTQADMLIPWYRYPTRKSAQHKLIFGHWSTIYLGSDKQFQQWNVYPLDTGCLWGGELTALRLEDERWFSVPSRQK